MEIEFKRLNEVDPAEIIELMNNRLVRRYMPLSPINFGAHDCEVFVDEKERMWTEHGFGPWAIVADERFVGWGGLQPENGEIDLALVLHPSCWGVGKFIYARIISLAFGEMGHRSVLNDTIKNSLTGPPSNLPFKRLHRTERTQRPLPRRWLYRRMSGLNMLERQVWVAMESFA